MSGVELGIIVTVFPVSRGGPVIAATDYMRLFADQIRPYVPGRYKVLWHRRLRPLRPS
jgi:pyruvate dehydrogenase complex dehydrogenase (E1) component